MCFIQLSLGCGVTPAICTFRLPISLESGFKILYLGKGKSNTRRPKVITSDIDFTDQDSIKALFNRAIGGVTDDPKTWLEASKLLGLAKAHRAIILADSRGEPISQLMQVYIEYKTEHPPCDELDVTLYFLEKVIDKAKAYKSAS